MSIDTTNHAELFRAANLLRHANMRCEDCDNMRYIKSTDTYYCPEATEALALEGYPTMIVRVDPENSAESCPRFVRSAESRNGDSNDGWQLENGVDAAFAEKAGK